MGRYPMTADVTRGCLAHGPPLCSDAGIETPIGCPTSRTTGITDYLTNGGRIEVGNAWPGLERKTDWAL
jgi:hypothetical protein